MSSITAPPDADLEPKPPAKRELVEKAEGGRIAPSELAPWDGPEAVHLAARQQLSSDTLHVTARRLSRVGAFGAAAFAAYGALGLLAERTVEGALPTALIWVAPAGALLSLALFAAARTKAVKAQYAKDLGNVYLILVSLLLGLLRHSETSSASDLLRQVSPVSIPILAFGALIPLVPRQALIMTLVAAAMDPLGMLAMGAQRNYALGELPLIVASPLLAALLALQISRVVHHLNEGIVKAREVGSYELVERLGVGGMAEVWRAQHRMLARPAAIKLIRPKVLVDHGPLDSERLLRLFTREVRATASLSSPHTIQVYDFGITREGAFYYVMELLDGIDLNTLVERFGPIPAERAAQLMIQVCHSLAEAHARSFVHRDVKPANILTCRVGEDFDFVKVLDFGLVLDRHPTSVELEDEKRFVGTPSIMAPEMVRFQAPVDARADLYALGCVGYFLVTGKRVFDAATRQDMLVMHAHQKPLLPSKRIDTPIHPGFETILMQCLEKNPNRRPQTARELSEALSALQFESTWSGERAELWWRQHRADVVRRASLAPLPPADAPHSEPPAPASTPDAERAPISVPRDESVSRP